MKGRLGAEGCAVSVSLLVFQCVDRCSMTAALAASANLLRSLQLRSFTLELLYFCFIVFTFAEQIQLALMYAGVCKDTQCTQHCNSVCPPLKLQQQSRSLAFLANVCSEAVKRHLLARCGCGCNQKLRLHIV